MSIKFTKMHGLGNDFVVIDAVCGGVEITSSLVRRMSDRHFGIGCDQLLLLEAKRSQDTDFFYRIFNADGSEVGQCGNGARCLAKYIYEQGLILKREIVVGTLCGKLVMYLEDDGDISVNMGSPNYEGDSYKISQNNNMLEVGVVDLGNPHAVLKVDDIDSMLIDSLSMAVAQDKKFSSGVNIEFMQILARDEIKLRVFERGSGETMACGSGACAAVVVGRIWHLLDSAVTVHMPGGSLVVRWHGAQNVVWMKGPAIRVFEGLWID